MNQKRWRLFPSCACCMSKNSFVPLGYCRSTVNVAASQFVQLARFALGLPVSFDKISCASVELFQASLHALHSACIIFVR